MSARDGEAELPILAEGERRVVSVDGREVLVLCEGGRHYALENRCPHLGASFCKAWVGGSTLPSPPGEHRWGLEGQVIRCPWHGWEFDLATGRSLFDPEARVRTLRVEHRGDRLLLRR